jgi:3-dehydroquinate dehydratase-2
LQWFQSNAEHELIARVHQARDARTALTPCNAGAFTHTSIALRDAFAATAIPFIEVHLSNVFAREPFRHHSHLSDIAVGVICGFGGDSYRLALEAAIHRLQPAATGAAPLGTRDRRTTSSPSLISSSARLDSSSKSISFLILRKSIGSAFGQSCRRGGGWKGKEGAAGQASAAGGACSRWIAASSASA